MLQTSQICEDKMVYIANKSTVFSIQEHCTPCMQEKKKKLIEFMCS